MPDANWTGFQTLLEKELRRFWKVSFQTVGAPVLTALLFLLIFSHVLDRHVTVYGEIAYTRFLVPGLAMMSLLQNAFANSSSSLIQSKITGSILFMLLPPLSYRTFFAAYVCASAVRGVVVAAGVIVVASPLVDLSLAHPVWVLVFALMGGLLMGAMGLIAGIVADKFDQLAAFQNFLIMPFTMLSGVFYSIHSLPDFWQQVSHINPFFFMIDGFRFGFFGASDVSPWLSLLVVGLCLVAVSAVSLNMLARGYKLRG